MSDAYIGEIRHFSGSYAPRGWAFCNGQMLPIAEYDALYSLLRTTYGGDGVTTFALPDLRARIPIHRDATHAVGAVGGSESVMLAAENVPDHSHNIQATPQAADSNTPSATAMLARAATNLVWSNAATVSDSALSAASTSFSDTGGTAVPTVAPSMTVNFIICTAGIWPPEA